MRIIFLFIFILIPLFADIGSIGAYQGKASLLREEETLGVSSGMVLQENDAIITQEKSKVQLIMKDETIITIGPSSHFEIDSYRFESKAQNTLSMQLRHGFFRAITGKIGKIAPERFKIRTKSATIGIRGTDFAAYIDDKTEYIACFHGSIQVITDDKNFDLNTAMMIMLSENRWKELDLDIQKFRPLLYTNEHQSTSKNSVDAPFDSATIESISQQERLQNANFNITPGYDITTSPPPFIP